VKASPEGHCILLSVGKSRSVRKERMGRSASLRNWAMVLFSASCRGLPGRRYSASVQAKQETVVVRLDGAELTRQFRQHSAGVRKFNTALLKLLASRLTRMNEQILESQVQLDTQKKGEIECLRERILRDWSF